MFLLDYGIRYGLGGWTKTKRVAAAKKAARTRKRNATRNKTVKKNKPKKTNKKSQIMRKAGIDAHALNRESEVGFRKLLQKRLTGKKSMVFLTSTNGKGLPDVVQFNGKQLDFFEIKPGVIDNPKSKRRYLNPDQVTFMNKCLDRGIAPYIVFYKKRGRMLYHIKQLKNEKQIMRYSQTNEKRIKPEKIKKLKYSANPRV